MAMNLKGLDVNSPTWHSLEQFAQQQVDTLREKNDSFSLDPMRTAEIRGRIAVWKELLALAQPAPVQAADISGWKGY